MGKRKSGGTFRVPAKFQQKGKVVEYEQESEQEDLKIIDDREAGNESEEENEVLNLEMSSESDEGTDSSNDDSNDGSDDDDDDEHNLNELVQNLPPKLRQKVLMGRANEHDGDSDEDEDESADEKETNEKWRRNEIWKGDVADLEIGQDVKDAYDEEEAAKAQLKKKLSKMHEDDFFEDFGQTSGYSSNEMDEDEEIDDAVAGSKSKKSHDPLTGHLESLILGRDKAVVQVEKLQRDVSKMTKQQKLSLLSAESPELLGLVSEFEVKYQELQTRILPGIELLKRISLAHEVPSECMDYMEIKIHLLQTYSMNMMFYLFLKASGKSTLNHPVLKQLLSLRYGMEKLRRLDKRFQGFVDDLQELGVMDVDAAEFEESVAGLVEDWRVELDSSNSVEVADEMNVDDGEDQVSDDDEEELQLEDNSGEEESDEGDDDDFADEDDEEMNRNMDDAKFEGLMSVVDKKFTNNKNRSKMNRNVGVEDVGEFEERGYNSIFQYSNGNGSKTGMAEPLQDAVSAVTGVGAKGKKSSHGNDDSMPALPDASKKKKQSSKPTAEDNEFEALLAKGLMGDRKRQRAPEGKMNDFSVHADDDGEENMFEAFTNKKKEYLEKKKEHYSAEKKYSTEELVHGDSGKRAISYEIMKNKGLTPHRKAENRNPRVKKRKAYEKAVVARKGQVRDVVKGAGASYGGEMTGIKSNLARSRKITN